MKTIDQMLHELGRSDVSEFALLSDRLPCVRVGTAYEPVDDRARSSEAILEILVRLGGSRYVDNLESEPAKWTTTVSGVGAVRVHAIMRGGRVQARFTVVKRVAPGGTRAALSLPAPSSIHSGASFEVLPSQGSGQLTGAVPVQVAGASFDSPITHPGERHAIAPPVRAAEESFDAPSSEPSEPPGPRTLSAMLHTALSKAAVDVEPPPAIATSLSPLPIRPSLGHGP